MSNYRAISATGFAVSASALATAVLVRRFSSRMLPSSAGAETSTVWSQSFKARLVDSTLLEVVTAVVAGVCAWAVVSTVSSRNLGADSVRRPDRTVPEENAGVDITDVDDTLGENQDDDEGDVRLELVLEKASILTAAPIDRPGALAALARASCFFCLVDSEANERRVRATLNALGVGTGDPMASDPPTGTRSHQAGGVPSASQLQAIWRSAADELGLWADALFVVTEHTLISVSAGEGSTLSRSQNREFHSFLRMILRERPSRGAFVCVVDRGNNPAHVAVLVRNSRANVGETDKPYTEITLSDPTWVGQDPTPTEVHSKLLQLIISAITKLAPGSMDCEVTVAWRAVLPCDLPTQALRYVDCCDQIEVALQDFVDSVVAPTDVELETARSQAAPLVARLAAATDLVDKVVEFGSVRRGTCVSPLHDLDFGLWLRPGALNDIRLGGAIPASNVLGALFARLVTLLADGQPVTYLPDGTVRVGVSGSPTCLIIRRQGVSIGVCFGTAWPNDESLLAGPTFDFVPLFCGHDVWDKGGMPRALARHGKPLEPTDPEATVTAIAELDGNTSGLFTRVVRLLKWLFRRKRKPGQASLASSFVMESVLAEHFRDRLVEGARIPRHLLCMLEEALVVCRGMMLRGQQAAGQPGQTVVWTDREGWTVEAMQNSISELIADTILLRNGDENVHEASHRLFGAPFKFSPDHRNVGTEATERHPECSICTKASWADGTDVVDVLRAARNSIDRTDLRALKAWLEFAEIRFSGTGTVEVVSQMCLLHAVALHGRNEFVAHLVSLPWIQLNQQAEGGTEFPLYVACKAGNLDAVRILVEAGADMKMTTQKYSKNLLHACVLFGGAVLLGEVLQKGGLDVDRPDSDGRTALFDACGMGNMHGVETLLAHNANPLFPDYNGLTPLLAAISAEHDNILKLFLTSVDVQRAVTTPIRDGHNHTTPLLQAAINSSAACVQLLCNLPTVRLRASTEDEMTGPLFSAAMSNSAGVVTVLLDTHLQELADEDGNPPLPFTSVDGKMQPADRVFMKLAGTACGPLAPRADIVHLLLKRDGVQWPTSFLQALLMMAVESETSGQIDVVRVILSHLRDTGSLLYSLLFQPIKGPCEQCSIFDRRLHSPTVYMCPECDMEACMDCFEQANHEHVWVDKVRALALSRDWLHLSEQLQGAIVAGDVDQVDALLECGADVHHVAFGTTAALAAYNSNEGAILQQLKSKGADTAILDALQHAISRGQCTHAATKDVFVRQRMVSCRTCGGIDVCVSCAERCHSDCLLSEPNGEMLAYCDCPHNASCVLATANQNE